MEKGRYAGDSGILLAPALQQGKRAGQDSGPHWKARDGKYRSHDHAAGRGRGVLNRHNELPRSKLRGIKKSFVIIFPKLSPPNVLIGGPVRVSPGFPLKACGNDALP